MLNTTCPCGSTRRNGTRATIPPMSMFRLLFSVSARILPLALVLGLGGCTGTTAPPPDLVLVSLDTVRADVFSEVAQADPVLGPVYAASTRFQAAATSAPLTLPAHASLLSGLDPNHHGIHHNGQRLRTDVPLLAERLRARGYHTAAVVSAFPLDRQFGLSRGFDVYDQPEATASASALSLLERRGDASTDRALAELDNGTAPQFLWLHLFDAHAPYAAPGQAAGAPLRDAYRAEVGFVVQQLGRIVSALKRRGRPFVLVVVGDHGEGLGDHDELDHGLLLYDSTLLVPMFWYAPGRFDGKTVPQTARLIDVAPTLAALAGAAPDPGVDGIDLVPLLSGGTLQIPAAYAETRYPELAYRKLPLRSVRDGDWKLIATRDEVELYRWSSDSAETHDLATEQESRAAAMQLDAWQRAEVASSDAPASPEVTRQLQGLGYVAAGEAASSAPAGHPRGIAASHRRLVALQSMIGTLPAAQVLAEAEAFAAAEPGNAFVQELLGSLLLEQGDLPRAIAALERASALNPDNSETRYKYAEALMRANRHADAIGQWQILEVLEPQRAGVWTNEAAALAFLGNWADAWTAVQQGLSLGANDANTLDNAALIAERLRLWADAAQLQQRRSLMTDPPFQEFGRLALNQLRSGDAISAQRTLDEAHARQASDPLLQLAEVLVQLRGKRTAEARRNAEALRAATPRLWQMALREFPELTTLPTGP